MERYSFVMYRSFFNAIQAIPNQEERAALYQAVCEYALDGTEPEISGVLSGMFELIRPQIDANNKRMQNGMRPKQKQTISKTEANRKQNTSKSQAKHKRIASKLQANDNDNDNDNDKLTCVSYNAHAREYPQSLQQLKEICFQWGISMSDDALENYYNIRVANDWINANGNRVANVSADLKAWAVREKQKQIKNERKNNQNGTDYSRNFSGDYSSGIHDTADDL